MVMLDSARPIQSNRSALEDSAGRTGEVGSTAPTTNSVPVQTSASALEWEPVEGVQPAAWVGRVRGIFVGMVEARWQEGFTATSRLGRKLGTFGTLADAQDAFVIHHPQRSR
jgi:hypothetical protein